MAFTRFFVAILVLPPSFVDVLTLLVTASEHRGRTAADGLSCHDGADETGLMQQTLKLPGNAEAQEHGESVTSESLPALRPDEGLSFFQIDERKNTVVEDVSLGAASNDTHVVATGQSGQKNLTSASPAIAEVSTEVAHAKHLPSSPTIGEVHNERSMEPSPFPSPAIGDVLLPDELLLPSRANNALGASAASQRPLAYAQAVLIFAIVVVLVRAGVLWRSAATLHRDLSRAMRQKLECMRVATGPEVRSVLGLSGEETKGAAGPEVMRIQGRIVEKSVGSLSAPLSNRPCVQYSASVSQHRHDGVHEPPVAFHSTAKEFSVQLEDCPEMLLDVQGQDVYPFDMESGRYACESAFVDAPDSWRSFLLAHLTPNVEGATGNSRAISGRMNCVDLGAKGPLQFRECALVVGARVTCVGEVVRERNGRLRLCPWSPPPDEAMPKIRAMWRTPKPDPWVNKLMISDDSRLLVEAQQLKCRSCS